MKPAFGITFFLTTKFLHRNEKQQDSFKQVTHSLHIRQSFLYFSRE